MKYLIFIVTLVWATFPILSRPSFDIGTSLWQNKSDAINTLDIGISGYSLTKNWEYSFYIPLFIRFDNYPFTLGVPNKSKNTFITLESLKYTTLFIRNITYTNAILSTGIQPITKFRNRILIDSMFFGKPTFESTIPFEGSSFFLEHNIFHVYSSSLQNPSLLFLYADTRSILHTTKKLPLTITPLLWVDTHIDSLKRVDYGISNNLQYHFFKKNTHQLSIDTTISANFIHTSAHSFSYRNIVGLLYEVAGVHITLGSIIQSNNHILGPILSSLYSGRRNLFEKLSGSTIPAITFSVGSDIWEYHSFSVHLETYFISNNKQKISFRGEYTFQYKDIFLTTSILKENVSSLQDIITIQNSDTFIGFDISMNLIHSLFKVGSNTYINWNNNTGSAKFKLYLRYIF